MSKKASDNCKQMRAVAPWFCAIADAWGAGEGDWAYQDGRSVAVTTWAAAFDAGGVEAANQAVIELARMHGVRP